MEIIFAIAIFGLAALGLGLGLTLGRGPVRSSCGATSELRKGRCADCPLRRHAQTAEAGQ